MSSDFPQFSAAYLLNKLSSGGFIDEADETITRFVTEQDHVQELPLYLRALVGVGAFIASLCFIGLIAVGLSIRDEVAVLVWGLIFVVVAIVLQKMGRDSYTVKSSFFMQTSFTFMATGKALFTFSLAMLMDSAWGVSIALLCITLATYPVYRMSIDRFLSAYSLLFSVLINILTEKELAGMRAYFLNGFIVLHLLGVALLLVNVKIKRDYIPLMYALLFSLCSVTLFFASHHEFGYWRSKDFISPFGMTLLYSAGLVAAIAWVVGAFSGGVKEIIKRLNAPAPRLACMSAILLGLISAPGIILSIILLVLAYAKHERIMLVMGAVLVPVFLFCYYYNLDVSLMKKSGVLVGSGLLLLLGRFYIRFKAWDKEASQ